MIFNYTMIMIYKYTFPAIQYNDKTIKEYKTYKMIMLSNYYEFFLKIHVE